MEADTMVHRAQLLIKFIIACLLFSCNKTAEKKAGMIMIEGAGAKLEMSNGTLYHNGQLFSGTVYNFFPGTKDTSEILSFKNGKEHGHWKKFYPDRSLKETRQFDDGKKVGEHIAWWPNGKKQLHYNLVNDEYDGLCSEWNSDGLLIREMNYRNGHEEGSQKLWWDNGTVRANYVIADGRRYGLLGTKNCKNVSDSLDKK